MVTYISHTACTFKAQCNKIWTKHFMESNSKRTDDFKNFPFLVKQSELKSKNKELERAFENIKEHF